MPNKKMSHKEALKRQSSIVYQVTFCYTTKTTREPVAYATYYAALLAGRTPEEADRIYDNVIETMAWFERKIINNL